jgi:ABC-type sugar transport system ATPase subunit
VAVEAGGPVTVAIRPEALGTTGGPGRATLAPRPAEFVEWFGGERHVRLGNGPTALVWRTAGDTPVTVGDTVTLDIARDSVHLFASDGAALDHLSLPIS